MGLPPPIYWKCHWFFGFLMSDVLWERRGLICYMNVTLWASAITAGTFDIFIWQRGHFFVAVVDLALIAASDWKVNTPCH